MINQVFNQDCLEGMKEIPNKSIDMILCDLPYGTTACKWDVIIPFKPLWNCYERIIKDNGAIVLTASQPFTSLLISSNIEQFKYCWVWNKGNASTSLLCNYQPLKIHEDIIVFSKASSTYSVNGSMKYNPLYLQDKEIIKQNKPKSKASYYNGKNGINSNLNSTSIYKQLKTNYPKSILQFKRETGFHPTQKPVALFEYLIKTYTNEGETVLDNCMGSGTTAIACINTNRNYIGFEKEEKYFNIIQDRIKKHTPQLKLIA